MMNHQRRNQAALRFQERRSREDDASRLRDEIPQLESLSLDLSEYRADGCSHLARHTRHVVIQRAPALFVVQCCDSDCDGAHDLTRALLRMLRSSEEQFEGVDECYGVRNRSTCHNQLRYQARAKYSSRLSRADQACASGSGG